MGVAKRAVVLLSGGLDSTTVLAMALAEGYECSTMSFDYGQRHRAELAAARRISTTYGVIDHRVVNIDLAAFGGSALTDDAIAIPESEEGGIPVTYVPARNTIFLSLALAWSEVFGAEAIFIGVNAVDYSGYPDCRPEYVAAFEKMANLATKAGVEGRGVKIKTPLLAMSKSDIIRAGVGLGVDYSQTVSCYQADELGKACGRCDSCRLRLQGFAGVGLKDSAQYYKLQQ